jgi:hypothetical protein
LKRPKPRLTLVITGENQSRVEDLLLVVFNYYWTSCFAIPFAACHPEAPFFGAKDLAFFLSGQCCSLRTEKTKQGWPKRIFGEWLPPHLLAGV